jgi:membrane-bound serine protease (ClpP class)
MNVKTPFLALILIAFFILPIYGTHTFADNGTIIVVEIKESITTATAELVSEGILNAESVNANAVILLIDTFGGTVDATYKIIDAIHRTSIPVIGYVYPTGAKALSAGSFILMACSYAAMAPYTTIGAAQPVMGTEPTNETKFINPLVEEMRILAKMHGRNETQAALFITKNHVLDSEKALERGVIEDIASDLQELIERADGKEVVTGKGPTTLKLSGSNIVYYSPSARTMFMRIISDPLINPLLFTIGFLALLFGLTAPGYGPEILGLILILLALIGMGFNVDLIALGILGLGMVLLLFEIYTPGFGLLGVGGITLLGIGLVLLVTKPFTVILATEEFMRTLMSLSLAFTAILAALFALIIYKTYKVMRAKKMLKPYPEGTGRAVDDIGPDKSGYVVVRGEYWRAKGEQEIKAGDEIEVIGYEDGKLIVRKKGSGLPPSTG